MEENIFSNIKKEELVLPLTVLENYADLFNRTYKGNLVFESKTKMENKSDEWDEVILPALAKEQVEKLSVSRTYIVVPGLSNYRLLILKLSYKISEVYPCQIEDFLNNQSYDCKDSTEVDNALVRIFKSEKFTHPIKMLLSQIE